MYVRGLGAGTIGRDPADLGTVHVADP